ncbi:MAG: hypothetical protein SNH63_04820 [Rikenellaceae bacterium]
MERKLEHFGIPMPAVPAGANYAEGLKIWMTDPSTSANNLELLHFEEGTPFPVEVCTIAHVAYSVESLDEAMAGKRLLFDKLDCGDYVIAFVEEEGIPVEYIEYKK